MAKNEIAIKTPRKKLTKKQLKQLASFTDPGTILASLANEGWTIEESIQHLVAIAKDEGKKVKDSTRLATIKYLNQLVVDAMERSGMMMIATKKFVGEDGGEYKFSGHIVESVLRGQKEQTTPAELSTDIIKKENEDENSKSESTKNGEGERKSSLHISKPPTGAEADNGHFNGISTSGENDTGVGDFI